MPTRRPLIRNPTTNALEDMQPADNLPGVPLGGAAGNVLTKNSGADHDASWVAPSGDGSDYASRVGFGRRPFLLVGG